MSKQTPSTPTCILVFSGKRKSGKDFLADHLTKFIGEDSCCILRLSAPLKKQYAKEHGLDYSELLNSSAYKEIHRAKMIVWGEEKRNENPGFFCDIVTSEVDPSKLIWIISDARRKTDIKYFRDNYPKVSKFVRIIADDNIRKERGFEYTPGVDNVESECGLDEGVEWDFIVENNGDSDILDKSVGEILTHVQTVLGKS